MSKSSAASQSAQRKSAQLRRSWLSLLLLLHCVCVALALSANYRPSSLQRRALMVLSPYLQSLHLDPQQTSFHFTHGAATDTDLFLEVLPAEEDGQWRGILPAAAPGTPSRLRSYRWARHWALLAEQENEADLARMAADAARQAMAAGITPQRIRCRRQLLLSLEDDLDSEPPEPTAEDILYEAYVLLDDDQVRVVKASPDAESALPKIRRRP